MLRSSSWEIGTNSVPSDGLFAEQKLWVLLVPICGYSGFRRGWQARRESNLCRGKYAVNDLPTSDGSAFCAPLKIQ